MICLLRPIAIVLATGLMAVPPGLAARYDDCVATVNAVPETGFEAARSWVEEDDDPAARHCLALALVRLGRFEEAASELTKLVDASAAAPVHHQVSLLSQAGQAWILAGAPALAEAAFARALTLTPDDPDLLIDRARARADRDDYWGAVEDLDAALDIAPGRDDAFAFRAAAYRRLEFPDLAADDVTRALAHNPSNVDALLERAILALAVDAVAAARTDLSRVLLTDPTSKAAALAREFLTALDAKDGL
ncbi:MAG: tetratricopeptide repeat protein [Alphaproteobacteria bacterium]